MTSFSWSSSTDTVSLRAPYMFTAGKLNSDNRLDVYVVDDGRDALHFGTGTPPTFPETQTNITRTNGVGGNVKMVDFPGDADDVVDAIGVADVDVDFNNSCNVCMAPCLAGQTCCTITGGQCTSNSQCPIVNSGGRTFALLKNVLGTVSDPWAGLADQNFHVKAYDFAFVDINRDGCLDLFMGMCGGYKVLIRNCQG